MWKYLFLIENLNNFEWKLPKIFAFYESFSLLRKSGGQKTDKTNENFEKIYVKTLES